SVERRDSRHGDRITAPPLVAEHALSAALGGNGRLPLWLASHLYRAAFHGGVGPACLPDADGAPGGRQYPALAAREPVCGCLGGSLAPSPGAPVGGRCARAALGPGANLGPPPGAAHRGLVCGCLPGRARHRLLRYRLWRLSAVCRALRPA